MNNLDVIKKSIYDDTVVRDTILDNAATKQYYKDLLKALSIKNFPLIEVNTIAKKTYMLECRGNAQCYLVFDHYLMDNIHILNQVVLGERKAAQLDAYFFKTMAEECYANRKYTLAIKFAGSYLNIIEGVIKQYLEEHFADQIPNYLFIQQAFLIAHELFHFILNQEPSLYSKGIKSKANYLKTIYDYAYVRDRSVASLMQESIKDTNLIEECFCDSTGIIQAIDVGIKLEKLNVIESSLAIALAIMNQFTVSSIQSVVKQSGRMSYDGVLSLFNMRVLHFKAYTSRYIEEFFSKHERQVFQREVENIYMSWMEKVQLPIIKQLHSSAEKLNEHGEFDLSKSDEMKRAKRVLRQIFNS